MCIIYYMLTACCLVPFCIVNNVCIICFRSDPFSNDMLPSDVPSLLEGLEADDAENVIMDDK